MTYSSSYRKTSLLSLILLTLLFYALFLTITYGWGFLIGGGLTWVGLLDSPTPAVIFFLVLNHLALFAHIWVGNSR